jgi:hypothetical protein
VTPTSCHAEVIIDPCQPRWLKALRHGTLGSTFATYVCGPSNPSPSSSSLRRPRRALPPCPVPPRHQHAPASLLLSCIGKCYLIFYVFFLHFKFITNVNINWKFMSANENQISHTKSYIETLWHRWTKILFFSSLSAQYCGCHTADGSKIQKLFISSNYKGIATQLLYLGSFGSDWWVASWCWSFSVSQMLHK